MTPFERSLSKLSENHKNIDIGSTVLKLWLLEDVQLHPPLLTINCSGSFSNSPISISWIKVLTFVNNCMHEFSYPCTKLEVPSMGSTIQVGSLVSWQSSPAAVHSSPINLRGGGVSWFSGI